MLLKKLSPLMLQILRWLAQQPVQIYDFAVVADSIVQPRVRVETSIKEMQRRGLLERAGPKAEKLRARHAYLKRDDVRAACMQAPGAPAPVAGADRLAMRAEKQIASQAARDKKEQKAQLAQQKKAQEAQQEHLDAFNAARESRKKALMAAMTERQKRIQEKQDRRAEPAPAKPVSPPPGPAVAAPVADPPKPLKAKPASKPADPVNPLAKKDPFDV